MPSIPISNGAVATSETPKDKKHKKNKDKKNKNDESSTQVLLNDAVSERESKKKSSKKRKKVSSSSDEENEEEKSETSSELVEPHDEGLKSKKEKKKNKKAKVEMEEEEEEEEKEIVKEKEEHPNAITKFRISEPLRLKLKEKGIESLFPIQAMTFDIVLDGSDLVGRARTGQVSDVVP